MTAVDLELLDGDPVREPEVPPKRRRLELAKRLRAAGFPDDAQYDITQAEGERWLALEPGRARGAALVELAELRAAELRRRPRPSWLEELTS